MGLISFFINFRRVDEKVDISIKRDYLSLPIIVGLYPNLRKKYIFFSIFQLIVIYSVLIFHFCLFLHSSIVLLDVSFTLASFLVQITLLILFTIFLYTGLVSKRGSMNILHGEMVYEIFKYEREDKGILDELHGEIAAEKNLLLAVPLGMVLAGTSALVFRPLLDSSFGDFHYNGTELSADSWNLPIGLVYHPLTEQSTFGFYFAVILEFFTAYLVVSIIGVAGLLFINVNQIYCLNLKYLSYNVERLQERAEELYLKVTGVKAPEKKLYENPIFIRCYQACLKRTFQHHQLILRWIGSYQDLAGTPLGLAYGTGTIVIALSLMAIKTGLSLPGTLLSSILLCIAEIGFMALLSFLGQRITDLSEDLRFKFYSTRWYDCPKSINSELEIFQEVTLKPLKLQGFGLVAASNDTFSNVMNSAYSYYNLIMAV